ncbi:MAG TPA: hypothetical protein VMT32_12380 [Bryobacteraceae bacterium]|nr:hypothetical protein [Bryobacteraceae bacterium]
MTVQSRAGDGSYMARKLLAAAILLLALVPSAHLAWVAREMPHFGHLHDDSIYWVSAKSLAEGRGYRILSLPGEPFQTKYPPLWPAVLAVIWRINPHFPENLKLGMALAWLMLPAFMAFAWRWFRSEGFSLPARVTMCAMIALSPTVVFFSTSLLSDLAFSALLVAAICGISSAERRAWTAVPAGLLGATAYLVRTAALPLLIAGPLWLALRKRYYAAALFFSAMFPAVAGWSLWTRGHLRHATDIVSLYYIDYMGYRRFCMGWRDLPVVIWKNLDGLFHGTTGFVMCGLRDTPMGMYLSRLLAIGAIAGVVRLARRGGMTPYHWFAAGYAVILLVWHFPPDERFLLPVFPLLLAGFATEGGHLAGVMKKAWSCSRANRAVACGLVTGVVAAAGLGIVLDADALFCEFPGIIEQHRTVLAGKLAAFRWIAQNTPCGSFYAYDDVVAFLYTGRHAVSLPVLPMPFYHEDRDGILEPLRAMPAFTREQHLDYLLFTATDFHRELPGPERAEARKILTQEPAFERVYQSQLCAVYRVMPPPPCLLANTR